MSEFVLSLAHHECMGVRSLAAMSERGIASESARLVADVE